MQPTTIPIVTFVLARPFARELVRANQSLEKVLLSVDLDPEKQMEDDVFIPAQKWYDFADAVARQMKDEHLGYRIGAGAALETLPNLKVLELPHATLGELLTALVIDVHRFSTIATYVLSTDGVHAKLETTRTFKPCSPPSQIDGYFAGFMVRILSLCAGPRWAPQELEISVCDTSAIPAEVQNSCHVRTGGLEGASFRFPAQWMLQRTDGVVRQTMPAGSETTHSFLDAFRAMLDLHLDRQGLSLAVFSALNGQSASTLKRRLNSHGTTYQIELDQRRSTRAIFLLQATTLPAAEIGHKVGYPDPPSFGRAFKRWTGVTPAQYRKSIA